MNSWAFEMLNLKTCSVKYLFTIQGQSFNKLKWFVHTWPNCSGLEILLLKQLPDFMFLVNIYPQQCYIIDNNDRNNWKIVHLKSVVRQTIQKGITEFFSVICYLYFCSDIQGDETILSHRKLGSTLPASVETKLFNFKIYVLCIL